MRRVASGLAWALAGLVIALGVGYVVLYLTILSYPFQPYGYPGAIILFCIPGAVFGALIIARQPSNGVGWALLLSSFFLALTSTAQVYTVRAVLVDPGTLPLAWMSAWFGSWMWVPGVAIATVFLPLFFPDSSLRGWPARALAAASFALVSMLTLVVASLTYPGTGSIQVGPDAQLAGSHSVNSLGIFGAAYSAIPILALAALVRLGFRLRGSRGEQRQQFKWFAYACGIVVLGVAASSVGNILSPPSATNEPQGTLGHVSAAMLVTSLVAIPIGTGISVLKYRLYDIDIVINRTIVYGLMAISITAAYIAIVVGVGSLVGSAGRSNLLLSILATALVALAFQPLRARLQRVANRLVYGKRATPYEVLSSFSEGVGETYAGEEVLVRMARLLAEASDATRSEVWVRVGGELRPAATWPASAAPSVAVPVAGQLMPAVPAPVAVAVRHGGELLGAISLTKRGNETLTPVETKLIEDLANQAGLVLKNAGLTADLQARLEELRASRQRLVAAQDQERRRIERNLHDGAQQHLVALKVKLGLLKMVAAKDPNRAAALVEELSADADETLETLRDLARGIYPPLLADKGLPAALEAQARKATVPVSVDGDGVGRYAQEVEAAVYFCCLEALQNTQKYAGATSAAISLGVNDGKLSFTVTDDGAGFDPMAASRGAGLTNMADRLDALGGRLQLESGHGRGTIVTGVLPALPR